MVEVTRHGTGQKTGWAVKALVVVVFAAVATFNVSYFLGLHLHVLPDGRTVVHSHPVDQNSQDGTHQHSANELAFLAGFAKLLLVDETEPHSVCIPFVPCAFTAPDLETTNVVGYDGDSPHKRSPPAVTPA
jgi:hypothetical protein